MSKKRLDRVLRVIPNVHNIADDLLVEGIVGVPHDKSITTLLELARANNITFKFVFKSKDLKFFDGNLIPEGYKIDPRR